MPARLDELSLTIGTIKADVKELQRRAQEDREAHAVDRTTHARFHAENQERMGAIAQETQKAIGELRTTADARWTETGRALERLTIAVGGMQPQISNLQASRTRILTLASIGLLALWVLGHAIEAGLRQMVEIAFKKFGGP